MKKGIVLGVLLLLLVAVNVQAEIIFGVIPLEDKEVMIDLFYRHYLVV